MKKSKNVQKVCMRAMAAFCRRLTNFRLGSWCEAVLRQGCKEIVAQIVLLTLKGSMPQFPTKHQEVKGCTSVSSLEVQLKGDVN